MHLSGLKTRGRCGDGDKIYSVSQAWLPVCSKISMREKERRWWRGKVPLIRMPVGNRIFLAYQETRMSQSSAIAATDGGLESPEETQSVGKTQKSGLRKVRCVAKE